MSRVVLVSPDTIASAMLLEAEEIVQLCMVADVAVREHTTQIGIQLEIARGDRSVLVDKQLWRQRRQQGRVKRLCKLSIQLMEVRVPPKLAQLLSPHVTWMRNIVTMLRTGSQGSSSSWLHVETIRAVRAVSEAPRPSAPASPAPLACGAVASKKAAAAVDGAAD
eukprot:CAMPEP_0174707092 /NCGR_PEP_ID=MMETSP1094-20130205/9707_1 /TAXON_ID=156173 /ORGANISM="Chrysochromulina brevifilum, Strain UTEX LB 985" /LENGTH=164 /DNA_ID=CAMNT_0015905429 /DNA_START=303 /DNA_END=798 /DNA_ORIENTATION=-